MSNNIVSIQIDKIVPHTEIKIEKTYINRMKNYDKELLPYDILLAVEKIGEDKYLLVGGLDRYAYLKSSGYKNAPCLIENTSISESIMDEKILRRLFAKGDCLKENKQILFKNLNETNLFPSILKKIGISKTEYLNNYKFSYEIPKKYLNENTNERTMNMIKSLVLKSAVTNFLYEKAGLPVGEPSRLTIEKLDLIIAFIKQNSIKFKSLTVDQQIRILSYAINYKTFALGYLQSILEDYYKFQKTG